MLQQEHTDSDITLERFMSTRTMQKKCQVLPSYPGSRILVCSRALKVQVLHVKLLLILIPRSGSGIPITQHRVLAYLLYYYTVQYLVHVGVKMLLVHVRYVYQ